MSFGERAVEIVQLAAKMPIDDLLRIPFSFPVYPGELFRALARAPLANLGSLAFPRWGGVNGLFGTRITATVRIPERAPPRSGTEYG
jgi:hypothetical protein